MKWLDAASDGNRKKSLMHHMQMQMQMQMQMLHIGDFILIILLCFMPPRFHPSR